MFVHIDLLRARSVVESDVMPSVVKSVDVFFYLIRPDAANPTFTLGEYPRDAVFDDLRLSDPASEEYRTKETLFGGELLCLLHEGAETILGCYYKDDLHTPLTEYKGVVEPLELRPGEGIVDVSYAAFFPADVVGIVKTSQKSPGHARMAGWLTAHTSHPLHLTPLTDQNPLALVQQPGSRIQRIRLKISSKRVSMMNPEIQGLAASLRASSKINPYAGVVGLELATSDDSAKAQQFTETAQGQLEELLEFFPDFKSATVKLEGHGTIDLKRKRIKARVPISLINRTKLTPLDAAKALFEAYERQRPSIDRAVADWKFGDASSGA